MWRVCVGSVLCAEGVWRECAMCVEGVWRECAVCGGCV